MKAKEQAKYVNDLWDNNPNDPNNLQAKAAIKAYHDYLVETFHTDEVAKLNSQDMAGRVRLAKEHDQAFTAFHHRLCAGAKASVGVDMFRQTMKRWKPVVFQMAWIRDVPKPKAQVFTRDGQRQRF